MCVFEEKLDEATLVGLKDFEYAVRQISHAVPLI